MVGRVWYQCRTCCLSECQYQDFSFEARASHQRPITTVAVNGGSYLTIKVCIRRSYALRLDATHVVHQQLRLAGIQDLVTSILHATSSSKAHPVEGRGQSVMTGNVPRKIHCFASRNYPSSSNFTCSKDFDQQAIYD